MSKSNLLKDKASIVGIGATEFRRPGAEMSLACEAVKAAIEDAGRRPRTSTAWSASAPRPTRDRRRQAPGDGGAHLLQRRIHHGGGCGGHDPAGGDGRGHRVADVVVAYRAFNERSPPLRHRRAG